MASQVEREVNTSIDSISCHLDVVGLTALSNQKMKPEARIGPLPIFAFACMTQMSTLPYRTILRQPRFVRLELHNLITGLPQVLFLLLAGLNFVQIARSLRWGPWVPVATSLALAAAVWLMNQCLPIAKGKMVILGIHG